MADDDRKRSEISRSMREALAKSTTPGEILLVIAQHRGTITAAAVEVGLPPDLMCFVVAMQGTPWEGEPTIRTIGLTYGGVVVDTTFLVPLAFGLTGGFLRIAHSSGVPADLVAQMMFETKNMEQTTRSDIQ